MLHNNRLLGISHFIGLFISRNHCSIKPCNTVSMAWVFNNAYALVKLLYERRIYYSSDNSLSTVCRQSCKGKDKSTPSYPEEITVIISTISVSTCITLNFHPGPLLK